MLLRPASAVLLALALLAPHAPARAQAPLPAPTPVETPVPAAAGLSGQPGTGELEPEVAQLLEAERVVLDTSFEVDPWEDFNRSMHRFNQGVDRVIWRPAAQAYANVVPQPFRNGVRNFFSNLYQPITALHLLLQGHPGEAGAAVGRFLVNITVGVGGLFDPATRFGIPHYEGDLGQTLAVWGWERSRYLVLPLLGPRTVRDSFGAVGDGMASPYRLMDADDATTYGLFALQMLDLRTQLFAVDRLTAGAEDEYAMTRDGWLQRRNYMIASRGGVVRQLPGMRDRVRPEGDPGLPDYLNEPLPGEEDEDPLPPYEPDAPAPEASRDARIPSP